MAGTGEKFSFCALALALAMLLTGCGSTSGSPTAQPRADWQELVDNFAGIALQKERDALRYERALSLAEDCLSGNAGAAETDGALEEIYTETMAEYAALEHIEISGEQKGVMEKYGIDPVDYAGMADERISDLYSHGQELYTLRNFVLAEDQDELSYQLDLRKRIRDLEVEYNAWAVNYLFCGWSGEKLAYVNERIIDQLAPEHRPKEWLTGRDEIEERVTACLDQWEEYVWELARHVERAELELGRIKQQRGPDVSAWYSRRA